MTIFKRGIVKIMGAFGYQYRYGGWRKKYILANKNAFESKEILSNETANKVINEKIKSGSPLLVARLGSVELSVLYNQYLFQYHKKIKWDKRVLETIQMNAGFFPVNERMLDRFAQLYKDCLKEVDLMGVWFNEGEEEICKNYCNAPLYIPLASIEPYYHNKPWSKALEGKKLLVIHPFEDSIQFQYNNVRTKLFADNDILPLFELKTIKAIQSIADNKEQNFTDWFQALEYMKTKIDKEDFDIAIIGAGAYGLPLAAYVKSKGKMAIHMGGATQIFFGVLGKRWEAIPAINKHFNENWKRPYEKEVPKNSGLIEAGCYW